MSDINPDKWGALIRMAAQSETGRQDSMSNDKPIPTGISAYTVAEDSTQSSCGDKRTPAAEELPCNDCGSSTDGVHHHTCPEAAAQHIPLTDTEPTTEELIACLGDDAAKLRNTNPEDEMATTMEIAAERLEALSRPAAPVEPADHVGDANDMMPSGRAT